MAQPTVPCEVQAKSGYRYEVQEQIGKGGFAVVHLAKQTKQDRSGGKFVALKAVVSKDMPLKVEQKLVTEMQIHSRLDHAHVVNVHRQSQTSHCQPEVGLREEISNFQFCVLGIAYRLPVNSDIADGVLCTIRMPTLTNIVCCSSSVKHNA